MGVHNLSSSYFTRNSIAAVNPLFGVVNFIVLSLPYGWKVRGEKLPPSVDRITKFGNVRWVSSGKIISIYYSREDAGIINIEVFEGDKSNKWSGDIILINGHKGVIRGYRVKKGFIRKKWVEVVDVSFYCEETNRSIRIRMYGSSLIDKLPFIQESLSNSVCH